jgi:uncharacterized protein YfbU (UPF0304 family)
VLGFDTHTNAHRVDFIQAVVYAASNNFELHSCTTSLAELMNFAYEVMNERTAGCLRNSVTRRTRDMHNVKRAYHVAYDRLKTRNKLNETRLSFSCGTGMEMSDKIAQGIFGNSHLAKLGIY